MMKLTPFPRVLRSAAMLAAGLVPFAPIFASAADISYSSGDALPNATVGNQLLPTLDVSGNNVELLGGDLFSAAGAYSGDSEAEVSGNTLTMAGGSLTDDPLNQTPSLIKHQTPVDGFAYGALSYGAGTVCRNTVEVTGGSLHGLVGGRAWADVVENTAILDAPASLSVRELVGGRVVGSSSALPLRACGNKAVLKGGTVTHFVAGGHFAELRKGTSCHNVVELLGGTIASGAGVYGGHADKGDAIENELFISNGVVLADGVALYGGYAGTGNATGNRVVVDGVHSTAAATICAGASSSGTASDNHMLLLGEVNMPNVVLSGGDGPSAVNNHLVAENPNVTIASFENFDTVTLCFTEWVPGKDYSLTVADLSSFAPGLIVDINLDGMPDDAPIQQGDTLTIDIPGLTNYELNLAGLPKYARRRSRLSELMDLSLESEDDGTNTTITLMVEHFMPNPQIQALASGRAAAVGQLKSAGELVAGKALEAATRTHEEQELAARAHACGQNPPRHKAFFTMDAAHNAATGGSCADVDGLSLLAGVATELPYRQPLTLGAFVERGWGHYAANNNYAEVNSVRSSGELSYYGMGVLGRYEFCRAADWRLRGLSLDASLRVGRQETEYEGHGLEDAYGTRARYNITSSYIAGHLGASYSLRNQQGWTMLGYGQFFWQHLAADNARICGEEARFDSVESHRLRFGFRVAKALTERWMPYAGLSWEWEFSGAARVRVSEAHGFDSTHRGGTLGAEAGVQFRPYLQRPLWLEASLQGRIGQWEGHGARVGATLQF